MKNVYAARYRLNVQHLRVMALLIVLAYLWVPYVLPDVPEPARTASRVEAVQADSLNRSASVDMDILDQVASPPPVKEEPVSYRDHSPAFRLLSAVVQLMLNLYRL